MKRILIVEDHAILRDGLRAILTTDPEFEIVGEATDGLEAIRMCMKLCPDLVLLDFSMPRMNGVEAIADIKKQSPGTKILMLTVHTSEEYVASALRAGADGYAVKESRQAELIRAVRCVLQGKKYIPEAIAEKYGTWDNLAVGLTDEKQRASVLTKRETEVLKLVAEGYANKEIASLLNISPKTVDNHRTNVMSKLDLHSPQALTYYAIRIGLVE